MSEQQFEEQQRFQQRWMYFIYILLFAILVLFLYADVVQLVFGKPFGDKPAPNFILLLATVFILSFLFLLYQINLKH